MFSPETNALLMPHVEIFVDANIDPRALQQIISATKARERGDNESAQSHIRIAYHLQEMANVSLSSQTGGLITETLRELKTIILAHRLAFKHKDLAMKALRQGERESAQYHFGEAYQNEATAAEFYAERRGDEPTRSILYGNAAKFALDCRAYDGAQRLVCTALEGSPPPDIAQELNEVASRASRGLMKFET